MGKIQELSEQLANQIAAGEVVERPASVVKELLENAIDAHSHKIEIFIEEAGLKTIQIIDDGEGIAPDDMVNAFKRHATSKIHSRDDLFRIRTLGFRGEALPSIASVSKVVIESAQENAAEGSYLELDGGKVVVEKPGSLRKGTNIKVSDLFYNTPARLKYVKSLQTELANITDVVNRLALSHPDIAFSLAHDGHQLTKTNGSGDLKQTIAGIYGLQNAKKMLAIQAENLDFKISGYVSLPELTRAGRSYITTLINGRYIKNHGLNKAITNGYGSKLMIGRFPIAVIEIQTDPLLVDVNVHPTKQEVRFSKEEELFSLVSKAINDKLREQVLIPNVGANLDFKQKVNPKEQVKPTQLNLDLSPAVEKKGGKLQFDSQKNQFYLEPTLDSGENKVTTSGNVDNSVDNLVDECGKRTDDFDNLVKNIENSTLASQEETLDEQIFETENVDNLIRELPESDPFEPTESLHEDLDAKQVYALLKQNETPSDYEAFPYLEYFGQMHGTYLFAQSDRGLYIIDQHAAQERIKYEYYREKIGEVDEHLQELLIPIVLDYPNSDYLKLKEKKDVLVSVGIQLEDFGQNSFIVRAHPTWYPKGQEETIIREMIDMVLINGSVTVKDFRAATAIMMSCKRSIKANHHLSDIQARTLLADLAKCENPYNCPHGRPVLIHFTNKDLEKMFKRIQDPH